MDKEEQYFILAGWLDINNEMQKAENVEFLADLLGKKEVKSSDLAKTVTGKKKMLRVIEFMKEKNVCLLLQLLIKNIVFQ